MTTLYETDLEHALQQIYTHCGNNLRVATPLGLGKPHRLLNALYDAAVADPSRSLQIYTALSLNPPSGKSELEQRFLKPFTDRIYDARFPRLKYADARNRNQLPPNVVIEEFYMQSGALLGSGAAQQNYASLNYTHAARAIASRRANILIQKIASDGHGRYSLSCNTDLTQDLIDEMARQGRPKAFVVGEVDPQLPFIGGTAEVAADFFDLIVTLAPPHTPLFALPRQPVGDADYAIGFYASTLLKDGGTIQIGIGALADALAHALILRHTQNAKYRDILRALNPELEHSDLVKTYGGLEPFSIGLYGCSEMVNEGFRALVQHGIVKRRVVDDAVLQRKLIEKTATASEVEQVEREGQYLHGAFYLGSSEFYQWIRQEAQQSNTIGMQRISLINQIAGSSFELERWQRHQARFFNTCIMATTLGGAASETLENGGVVSGVGGQYNFVSMGHLLHDARSILMFRAIRKSEGVTTSNIRDRVAHLTIPRHLRDIYINEYGIADLRDATDADCIRRMVAISDQQFQADLLKAAIDDKKLPTDETVNGSRINSSKHLTRILAPFRADGSLSDYPLGSDFTDVEQRIVKALTWLKENTSTTGDKFKTLFKTMLHTITERHNTAEIQDALKRMQLDNPDGVEEKLMAEMLEEALRQTAS